MESSSEEGKEIMESSSEEGEGKKGGHLSVFNPTPTPMALNTASETVPAAAPLRAGPAGWERIRAIMDSGATVPVIKPSTDRGYEVEESASSRAGVEYETAGGDMLACLGRKRLAVLTAEGTLRGYESECADVSKSLASVRASVKSKHAVCFGLGPDGEDHLVINRLTGEINRLEDDGINYIQELWVVPPDQIAAVQQKLTEAQLDEGNGQDFAWPGR